MCSFQSRNCTATLKYRYEDKQFDCICMGKFLHLVIFIIKIDIILIFNNFFETDIIGKKI